MWQCVYVVDNIAIQSACDSVDSVTCYCYCNKTIIPTQPITELFTVTIMSCYHTNNYLAWKVLSAVQYRPSSVRSTRSISVAADAPEHTINHQLSPQVPRRNITMTKTLL